MSVPIERKLQEWLDASVIDADAAVRIRAFEAAQSKTGGFRWPVLLALAFGSVMVGAGLLLFVAAHWDELSPASRMTLVVSLVLVFHVIGTLLRNRFESMAVAMHALGTIALGAGIALTGQIYNLDTGWSGGAMLWAAGALIGWFVLRQWPQAALAAILVPFWLTAIYEDAARALGHGPRASAAGGALAMLAFTYLSARMSDEASAIRRAFAWIGGLAVIPTVIFTCIRDSDWYTPEWIALGAGAALSLGLAIVLRRNAAIYNAAAIVWTAVLALMHATGDSLARYGWLAIGSAALAMWGVREQRVERINLGVAGFAATVLFFYFASVMDRIGRSASLMGLGVLFLAGGYGLERLRRRLVAKSRVG